MVEVKYQDLKMRLDSSEVQSKLPQVGASFGKLEKEVSKSRAELAQFSGSATELKSKLDLGKIALDAFKELAASLPAIINKGQAVSELTTAFNNLGGSLPQLREATQGLISDMDLMRASNQAMLSDLSPEQFLTLATAADTLGDAVGIDAKNALDGLTNSIATGSEKMLKQFGIIVDNKKANENYAASLGVAADELNELGRLEAFRIEALIQIEESTNRLGNASDTAGDNLTRLQNALLNLGSEIFKTVNENELLISGLASLADIAETAGASLLGNFKRGLEVISAGGIEKAAIKAAEADKRNALKAELEALVALDEEYDSLEQELREYGSATERHTDRTRTATNENSRLVKAERDRERAIRDNEKALKDFLRWGYDYEQWVIDVNSAAIGPWIIDEAEAAESNARQQRALEQAYQASTDFWGQILTAVIDGDVASVLESMLTRQAVDFGANLLTSITQNLAGGLTSGALGNLSTLTGLESGGIGAAAGLTGISALNFGKDVLSGKNSSLFDSSVLAPVTGGFSLLGLGAGSLFGGGGRSAEQIRRDQVRQGLVDSGVVDEGHQFNLFGGGKGDLTPGGKFQGFNEGAEKFGGLGTVLSVASGGDNALKEIYANALAEAENFNAAALTTVGLLEDMGKSAEESQALIIEAYGSGQISIEEFNAAMDAAAILAREDLASIEEGVQLMAATIDGPPKDKIKALQLTFGEFKQAGVQDTEALLAAVKDKMGVEAVEIFKRLADAGITQFTDFNTLSASQIQLLFNEVEKLEEPLRKIGGAAEDAAGSADGAFRRIRGGLSDIKDDAERARKAVRSVGEAG